MWKDTRPDHIVEIGCNSGLLLNYLSTHLPDVKSAVGIDINHNQIQANRNNSRLDSRIEFVCGDGCDWIIKNAKPNSLFVTNGGVLEYFQRQRLDQLLTYLDQNLSPAYFFSIEPVATDHDWNEINESIPFGEELSFSHNYRDLFQSNGFQILHQRPTEFERWQMFTTLAQSVKVGSVLQQRLES